MSGAGPEPGPPRRRPPRGLLGHLRDALLGPRGTTRAVVPLPPAGWTSASAPGRVVLRGFDSFVPLFLLPGTGLLVALFLGDALFRFVPGLGGAGRLTIVGALLLGLAAAGAGFGFRVTVSGAGIVVERTWWSVAYRRRDFPLDAKVGTWTTLGGPDEGVEIVGGEEPAFGCELNCHELAAALRAAVAEVRSDAAGPLAS